MNEAAGRQCPIRYRYGAEAIARAPLRQAQTLYVVGGLYGNLPALDAVEAMARAEPGPVTLCFNGDFNWFNIDPAGFAAINRRVLAHDAILGNVEAEFDGEDAAAGCGCAYPEHVDAGIVERSNTIHARLKTTARAFPELLTQLAALPLFARYQVGGVRVGVVHGDADSLAGWGFDAAALANAESAANTEWLTHCFARAEVDVFASSHTCLPAMRRVSRTALVINNGAAGMPNFRGECAGLLTRISAHPSPHVPAYGEQHNGVCVDALPIPYDSARWRADFLANWPPGSAAWQSYFQRIALGPVYGVAQVHLNSAALTSR